MDTQPSDLPDLTRRMLLDRMATACLLAGFVSLPAAARADDSESGDSGGDDGGSDDGGSDDGGSDDGGADDSSDDSGSGGSGSDNGGAASSSRSATTGGGDDGDSRGSNGFRRGALDQSDALRAVQNGMAMPFRTALKKVASEYGGSVIDVTLQSTGRRLEYRFKLRTDRGTVRTVRMDARTGRFLGLGSLFR